MAMTGSESAKYKALFVCPLPPPVHGSAMVSSQIRESRAIGDRFAGRFVNLSTSRKISEIGHFSIMKPARYIASLAKTFFLLLTIRFDICYLAITCHGAGFVKDAPFVLLCKLFGRKVVIHQHNKGMSQSVGYSFFRWLLKLVYRNVKVILLSDRLYPDIEQIVDRSQVRICPNGIPDVTCPDKLCGDVPEILFVSNLLVSKGIFLLMDALAFLKAKGVCFHCSVVGAETGEIDRFSLESFIKTKFLENDVEYLGKKTGAEKDACYEKADIFVLPTMNECFGLVLLEAMRAGTACISTPEGGIPDVIVDGETGFLVDSGNEMALADSIERLILDRQLCKAMGVAGRKRYEANFTQESFEQNMLGILISVAEQR